MADTLTPVTPLSSAPAPPDPASFASEDDRRDSMGTFCAISPHDVRHPSLRRRRLPWLSISHALATALADVVLLSGMRTSL